MALLFLSFTIILYFIATVLQGFYLKKQIPKLELITAILSFFPIFSHAITLFLFIYYDKNINSFILISLAFWFINFLTYVSAFKRRSIQRLSLFTFPLAIVSLLLIAFFNHTPSSIDTSDSKQLFHVILSTFTFTAIFLAALQAIILAIQDRKLRKHHRGFISLLPSIESMETFLFQILTIGFFLLTTLLISSTLLFSELYTPKLINKLILSLSVWVVLAILLGGRLYSGWRGTTVIRWTLVGTSLLMLIYFGSLFMHIVHK